ncbi:MAG: glycosyltransferase family 4 protein [Bacteroidetes bacterium]|nr:glycosyltransferase family 4 protein [Bacteroidota bacterium]
MTILIIDNSVAFTGAFKCALNEALALKEKHRFVFVLPSGSSVANLAKEKGFQVHTLPFREISKSVKAIAIYPFALLKNTIALRKIVRHEHVELIQINDFYNLLGAALRIMGYKSKMFTYVRFLPQTIPSPLRKFWLYAAQKYSDKIIAVSDAVLNQLPMNAKNVRLYDPVNLSEHVVSAPKISEKISFLYLANFTRGKGQNYALEAFFKAFQENPNLQLTFAGSNMGLEKNEIFRQELISRTQALGLSSVVSFQTFVENVEIAIKNADIMLNFSDGESFSMTCLEASFYGTPMIATRCGGPEEIIDHNQTGILVAKANISEMTQAMLSLSKDKTMRKRFSEAGKTFVRKKFSLDTFILSFNALIS